eukprot:1091-Heterococcus_DN1.PRE.1
MTKRVPSRTEKTACRAVYASSFAGECVVCTSATVSAYTDHCSDSGSKKQCDGEKFYSAHYVQDQFQSLNEEVDKQVELLNVRVDKLEGKRNVKPPVASTDATEQLLQPKAHCDTFDAAIAACDAVHQSLACTCAALLHGSEDSNAHGKRFENVDC